MKTSKTLIALALALAGLSATGSAFAWQHYGPRVSIGFGFGFPAYPYYYPPYSYYPPYYPPSVVLQQQPTTYVEQYPQPAPAVQSPASNYWYYCAGSRAYYPYVKECPAGWQRVAPHPG